MTRTTRAAIVAVATLAATGCTPSPAPQTQRPNVLLVVGDDLNVYLGTYGYHAQTPHIDRLARSGRRFDAAYAQSSLCNPSRASFMTGWHPDRTRVWNNGQLCEPLLRDAPRLERVFRQAGYFTARLGKIYHFDGEFQWDLAEDASADPFVTDPDTGDTHRRHKFRFEEKWEPSSLPDAELPDGRTARRVVALLAERRDRPFFIAVGFVRPHGPWIAPKRYFDLYPEDKVALPSYPANDLDDVPDIALAEGAEPRIAPAERRRANAAYLACVSFMDAQLGVILDALDAHGLRRNTIVVVLGDQGIHRGEHGLWRKNTLFEESTRVPLLIATPDLREPGRPTRQLVELADLHSTLLELAGLPAMPGDGVSLVPLLRDPGHPVRRAAVTMVEREGKLAVSVRTERHRLNLWPDGSRELYDHATDPGEWTNRAEDSAVAGVIAELAGWANSSRSAILPSRP